MSRHYESSRRFVDSSNNAAGQAWKDQYVRSLVSVAGVWGGTARAVKVFAVGDNLDSWFLNEKNLLWERTNPSLAWLMPSADFWTDDEVSLNITILNLSPITKGGGHIVPPPAVFCVKS